MARARPLVTGAALLGTLSLGIAAPACAPAEEKLDASEEREGDRLARESGFGADPDYVVRQRVVFDTESADMARFERQPFSHRARKWHVYPMTVYPGARIGFRLQTEDREMTQVAELRVYGPALSDGAFPKSRSLVVDEHGQASLKQETLEPGRYVVVVGPREKSGFLPRYPGNVVSLKVPGAAEPVEFSLILAENGWTVTSPSGTYHVVGPLPPSDRIGANSGSLRLKAISAGAKDHEARIAAWSTRELYTSARGTADESVLGQVVDETLVLKAPGGDRSLLIQQSAQLGHSTEHILLQVLPKTIASDVEVPLEYRGVTLTMEHELDCMTDECRVPVVAEANAPACGPSGPKQCATGRACFGGKCLRTLPSSLVESVSESFKPLFIDPLDPSTYSLEVSCAENCMPTPVDRARMTKYPVYYAHGFNSSRETWSSVLEWLGRVPGFRDHSSAESVPAFEPIEVRANRLRQKLASFVRTMEESAPMANERMRVNVVAHSMGGLDARALISSPKFNDQCRQSECEDIVDEKTGAKQKTTCCAPSDANGEPTMWRDRIASVTTLSTPHRGSSFASWGLDQLKSGFGASLRLVAERFFGLDAGGYDGFKRTLEALSTQQGDEREKDLPAPNAARVYTWACATGQERCAMPAGSDAPTKGADGRFLLPPPSARPTIFSFAGVSCVTGGCGSVLDPTLILPSSVLANAGEKKNDGVVGIDRARYGIFMGVVALDHFDWTRTEANASLGKSALQWAFGIKNEPIERFHQTWLERLAQAGY